MPYFCNSIAIRFLKTALTLVFGFLSLSLSAQTFRSNIEVRDEYNKELISGAKIHLTEEGKHFISPSGRITFESNRRFHHLHIHASFYETVEVDIDLTRDTILTIWLHPTALEMRETLIEHALISQSQRSSTVAISMLTREDMLSSNPSSFAETLESIPGVSSNNVGVGIARPVIRGLAGTRIYVADMGLRQEGQQWGNDHGLELDQYGIERVELIRGPAGVVYGSDAMAGVVHILSDIWPQKDGVQGDLLVGYKTNNQNLFHSAGIRGLKNNFYFNVRFSAKSYSDMRVPIDTFNYLTFNLPIYERRLKNTAGREYNASLTLGYKTENSKFWIRTSHYHLNQGLFAGAIGVPNAYGLGHENNFRNIELPSQKVGHFKIDAHHVTRLSKEAIWSTDIGYQRNDRLEQSLAHLHGIVLNSPTDTAHHFLLQTVQFRTTYKRTFSPKSRMSLGTTGLYQENTHGGFEFLLPNFSTVELGLFGLIEQQINTKTTVNLGVRTDVSRVNSSQKIRQVMQTGQILNEELAPEIRRLYENWAAQIGLNHEITHQHVIKLNLARTYRFPRAVELAMNGVHHGTFRHEIGNPNLTPETAYQLDFLYEYHTDKKLFSITPFLNYYNNFIYLRPTGQFSPLPDAGQQFRYNQHDALLSGAEILIQQAVGEHFVFTTKAQYVHAFNLSLNRYLPFTPPLEVVFEPEFNWSKIGALKKIKLKPGVQYVFAQRLVDINEKTTPSALLFHADLNFKIGDNLRWKQLQFPEGLQINLALRNIFNTPYLKHLSRYRLLDITEPGFNCMLTIRIPFSS
jgi:iron complex outermembrane receptor protein